jgi:hypothetical protein
VSSSGADVRRRHRQDGTNDSLYEFLAMLFTTAQERVRVVTLAWERERTATDALARRVAEEEHFLHAFEVEHIASPSHQAPPTALVQSAEPQLGQVDPMVAYLHLQAAWVLHIKNLVTIVLDSTSISYACWRDQVLLALRRYTLDDDVLSDTPVEARDRRGSATTVSPCLGSLGPSPSMYMTSCALPVAPHVRPGLLSRASSSATPRRTPPNSMLSSTLLSRAIYPWASSARR